MCGVPNLIKIDVWTGMLKFSKMMGWNHLHLSFTNICCVWQKQQMMKFNLRGSKIVFGKIEDVNYPLPICSSFFEIQGCTLLKLYTVMVPRQSFVSHKMQPWFCLNKNTNLLFWSILKLWSPIDWVTRWIIFILWLLCDTYYVSVAGKQSPAYVRRMTSWWTG